MVDKVISFVRRGPFADRLELREMGGDYNGYVAIPPSNPLYLTVYDDIPIDIHGGWTFGARASELDWEEIPSDKDYWIIGWDTLHAGDSRVKWPKDRVERESARAAMEIQLLGIQKEREKNSKLRK